MQKEKCEELHGSPYKGVLKIKDSLKSKVKGCTNKGLSLGGPRENNDVETAKKIQAMMMMTTKRFTFTAMNNTGLQKGTGLGPSRAICGFMKTCRISWKNPLVIRAQTDV
jgi:hypothetical protein